MANTFVIPSKYEEGGNGSILAIVPENDFSVLFSSYKELGEEAFKNVNLASMSQTLPLHDNVSSCILYENAAQTVTLLDIPASISLTQGQPISSSRPWISSSPPPSEPYPSTEPKSEKAMHEVLSRSPPSPEDFIYRDLIKKALSEIRFTPRSTDSHVEAWCLERYISAFSSLEYSVFIENLVAWDMKYNTHRIKMFERYVGPIPSHLKPAEGDVFGPFEVPYGPYRPGESPKPIRPTFPLSEPVKPLAITTKYSPPLTLSPFSSLSIVPSRLKLESRLVRNPFPQPTTLRLTHCGSRYRIPPRSAFLLGDILCRPSLTRGVKADVLPKMLPNCTPTAPPGLFDCVIMDPPWGNRSAKRKGEYETQSNTTANKEPAKPIKPKRVKHRGPGRCSFGALAGIECHAAPGGLVLIWITHAASVREHALKRFRTWGVELVEEWIWAKVTSSGEPIYDIDGLWRKPWEVCLVGRRREDGAVNIEDSGLDSGASGAESGAASEYERGGAEEGRREVKRRVIVAVPDWHSRKPCLKELLKGYLPDHPEVRVLEVFARNLVSAWWSWGDDVLRFQWEGHWVKAVDEGWDEEEEQSDIAVADREAHSESTE